MVKSRDLITQWERGLAKTRDGKSKTEKPKEAQGQARQASGSYRAHTDP